MVAQWYPLALTVLTCINLWQTVGKIARCNMMIQVSQGSPSQHMHLRTAALLCLSWSWVSERTHPQVVLKEVAGLREEIREAREVIAGFTTEASSCEWKVWSRDWALKLSGLIDLVLLVWLLASTCSNRHRASSPLPASEPPEDSGEEPLPLKAPTPEALQGGLGLGDGASSPPSSTGRGRPTRPSDLKKWRT